MWARGRSAQMVRWSKSSDQGSSKSVSFADAAGSMSSLPRVCATQRSCSSPHLRRALSNHMPRRCRALGDERAAPASFGSQPDGLQRGATRRPRLLSLDTDERARATPRPFLNGEGRRARWVEQVLRKADGTYAAWNRWFRVREEWFVGEEGESRRRWCCHCASAPHAYRACLEYWETKIRCSSCQDA